MTSAIIVAAGSSRRMGFDKLSAMLCEKPVLQHTIEAFASAESIDSIVVVCPADRWSLLELKAINKLVIRADGGNDRQDSVMQGIHALPAGSQWVAIHDGARPLVSPADIDACVLAAKSHRAAALARRVTETLKRSDEHDFTTDAVDRNHLWCMETPQTFELEWLRRAYAEVERLSRHVTDEVSAIETIGGRVKLIESTSPNLKITTPADLALASAILHRKR